jgi:FixJ family two-component response regulator
MTDGPATIFVVDDDPSVRRGLERLLRSAGYRAETFASAREFLQRGNPAAGACLVLDVRMPGQGGLELSEVLAAGNHPIPVIFITGHGDIPMTVRAMKAGAAEFLTKQLRDDVLVNAIRGALERSRAARRVNGELQTLRTCYDSLTPREREVMARVTAGMLNKQVGGDLGISEITVKAHRGQVMRKMKADSLADLVTMAARLGLQPTQKH